MREVTERVQIGTRLLDQAGLLPDIPGAASVAGRAEPDGDGRQEPVPVMAGTPVPAVPSQGADGTLLAVVPIPGTGTSLAIIGYPVTTPGASGGEPAVPLEEGRPGLLLDHDQRRVWVDGKEVALTFQEFELLAFLSARPSTVFSRADLVRHVWQRDFSADSRTVDVHVSRLRHKLGPGYGRCLVTEYRVGYQFRPPTR
jgi:transcriptional regulator